MAAPNEKLRFSLRTMLIALAEFAVLALASARGLTLIKSFSDKVLFDQTGNSIQMTVNIEAPQAESKAVASGV